MTLPLPDVDPRHCHIVTSTQSGVIVVSVSGELGPDDELRLAQASQSAIACSCPVLLDLCACVALDAAALRALTTAVRMARAVRVPLAVASIPWSPVSALVEQIMGCSVRESRTAGLAALLA